MLTFAARAAYNDKSTSDRFVSFIGNGHKVVNLRRMMFESMEKW